MRIGTYLTFFLYNYQAREMSGSAAIANSAIANAIPHVVRDLLQAEVASSSNLNPVGKVLKILEITAARVSQHTS